MHKKVNSISINIVSVLIILVCLLLSIVTPTNAWFSASTNDGVIVSVDIGDLKLKVYQNSVIDANEIYSDEINTKFMSDNIDSTQPKYLVLSGEIIPDEPVDLVLFLANKDLGSTSMYVRFKFEIYVRGVLGDTKLNNVTLINYDVPNGTSCGFVKDGDYYYYKNISNENALLAKGQSVKMMEKFNVPLSCFMNDDGTMVYTNSESIYVKLAVEASINKNFA